MLHFCAAPPPHVCPCGQGGLGGSTHSSKSALDITAQRTTTWCTLGTFASHSCVLGRLKGLSRELQLHPKSSCSSGCVEGLESRPAGPTLTPLGTANCMLHQLNHLHGTTDQLGSHFEPCVCCLCVFRAKRSGRRLRCVGELMATLADCIRWNLSDSYSAALCLFDLCIDLRAVC